MSKQMNGWYGFDLDGTAAVYEGWKGIEHIGNPVVPVIALMKAMLSAGKDVRWLAFRCGYYHGLGRR